jgi:hypothetical protein
VIPGHERAGEELVADELLVEDGTLTFDYEIFEATAFIAFRLAFSAINDALGAAPDKQLADAAPGPVRAAVSYGRPPFRAPSRS